eukprot:SAG31_NODE_49341_length_144_cov_1.044444_1_plen_24_part_01
MGYMCTQLYRVPPPRTVADRLIFF